MPTSHWIYPTNERSHYVLRDAAGETEVSPEQLLEGIEREPDNVDPWLLSTGFRLMRPGDVVWIYASAPHQYICALAQAVDVDRDGDDWYVSLLWNLDATRMLMSDPIERGEFGQTAQRAAVRADPRTTAVVENWLRRSGARLGDLDRIPALEQDTRLRTMQSIVQRQGQPVFRKGLLEAYGRRCAITGETAEEVLEAAHIHPYRGVHSNKVTNGLLLRADLHTLFDRHLLGVGPDGTIVVSPRLNSAAYLGLHGRSLRMPRVVALRPSKRGLAAHLKNLCR